ncbi:MAG: hypothetical protein SVU32_05360, partial [Candidatus Nanohaloarchaea archaeon]|nr:hypothetical protein [Candidatus Nanohaloarchaea archaeon]
EPIQGDAQTTVKITWDPGNQQVSITPFQVCNPSRGDTCELSKCNCDTACIPPSERPYDPDGDGTADTNAYKCVKKEHFHVKGKGATCTFDFECRERLQCVNDGGTSTCQ